jgi:hypothetical protein
MKRTRWYCQGAIVLACFGMIVPERVLAATPTSPQPLVHDVALGTNGTLSGQVVDSQGLPLAGTDVTVWQNENQVAAVKADVNGNFAIAGLRSGVHHVAAGQSVDVYRFWAPNTAPPAAGKQALLVGDQTVARGNFGGGIIRFITNPWVLAGIVAAAIAIPIAVNNDDDSGSGS